MKKKMLKSKLMLEMVEMVKKKKSRENAGDENQNKDGDEEVNIGDDAEGEKKNRGENAGDESQKKDDVEEVNLGDGENENSGGNVGAEATNAGENGGEKDKDDDKGAAQKNIGDASQLQLSPFWFSSQLQEVLNNPLMGTSQANYTHI